MSDEIIIDERGPHKTFTNGQPTLELGERITTQVLDVGTQSAAFNALTTHIKITALSACWYKIGSNPSATANTDGNSYLGAGLSVIEPVLGGQKIDTAATA